MEPDVGERELLLSRVRAALGRERTETPRAPVYDTRDVRTVPSDGELVQHFARRAIGAGMFVEQTAAAGLDRTLGLVLARFSLRRVAVSVEDPALRTIAEHAAGTPLPWRNADGLAGMYDADAGITDIFAAIAETGTLVVRSSPPVSRGGFLVPPVHVALLPASRIIPDMVDLWPMITRVPTSLVLITGPSKTADIEGILITGVHGPRAVHIVLIEDA